LGCLLLKGRKGIGREMEGCREGRGREGGKGRGREEEGRLDSHTILGPASNSSHVALSQLV